MEKTISFVQIEHRVRPGFRNNINLAESSEDVKKFFVYAAQQLLNEALDGKVTVAYEDIGLAAGATPSFVIRDRLATAPGFAEVWHSSDLPAIVERLAEVAVNRLKHFATLPDKTENKMYPTASHGGRSFANPPGGRRR